MIVYMLVCCCCCFDLFFYARCDEHTKQMMIISQQTDVVPKLFESLSRTIYTFVHWLQYVKVRAHSLARSYFLFFAVVVVVVVVGVYLFEQFVSLYISLSSLYISRTQKSNETDTQYIGIGFLHMEMINMA